MDKDKCCVRRDLGNSWTGQEVYRMFVHRPSFIVSSAAFPFPSLNAHVMTMHPIAITKHQTNRESLFQTPPYQNRKIPPPPNPPHSTRHKGPQIHPPSISLDNPRRPTHPIKLTLHLCSRRRRLPRPTSPLRPFGPTFPLSAMRYLAPPFAAALVEAAGLAFGGGLIGGRGTDYSCSFRCGTSQRVSVMSHHELKYACEIREAD